MGVSILASRLNAFFQFVLALKPCHGLARCVTIRTIVFLRCIRQAPRSRAGHAIAHSPSSLRISQITPAGTTRQASATVTAQPRRGLWECSRPSARWPPLAGLAAAEPALLIAEAR